MMKSKKHTVSVGIAAYNEAPRIKRVLEDVLMQKGESWTLKEVRVYCDGCSDGTPKIARSLKNPAIKVIEDKNRRGKTHRLQQIFAESLGDIIVLFDADIVLANEHVIDELIQPLLKNKKVQLTGGNSRPFPPKSFFERAVYSTFEVFDDSRKFHGNGNNVFGCTGSCMATTRSFARTLNLANGVINEDAFIYLTCLKQGYTFAYQSKAVVYYSVPTKSSDYIKQVLRSEPAVVGLELEPFFGELVEQELNRDTKQYIASVLKAFVKNPIGVAYITTLNVLCKPFFGVVLKNYNLDWFTAHSTKQQL